MILKEWRKQRSERQQQELEKVLAERWTEIAAVKAEMETVKLRTESTFSFCWNVEADSSLPFISGKQLYVDHLMNKGKTRVFAECQAEDYYKKLLRAEQEYNCKYLREELLELYPKVMDSVFYRIKLREYRGKYAWAKHEHQLFRELIFKAQRALSA